MILTKDTKLKEYKTKKSCLNCKYCKFDSVWMTFFCNAKVIERGKETVYHTAVSKYIKTGIPIWCPIKEEK